MIKQKHLYKHCIKALYRVVQKEDVVLQMVTLSIVERFSKKSTVRNLTKFTARCM